MWGLGVFYVTLMESTNCSQMKTFIKHQSTLPAKTRFDNKVTYKGLHITPIGLHIIYIRLHIIYTVLHMTFRELHRTYRQLHITYR